MFLLFRWKKFKQAAKSSRGAGEGLEWEHDVIQGGRSIQGLQLGTSGGWVLGGDSATEHTGFV